MKRVLLAADGSSYSLDAARFLSRIAHHNPIQVTVLTVIEPAYVNPKPPTPDWMIQRMADEDAAAIHTYEKVKHVFSGLDVMVSHELRKGPLGETIVRVAEETDSELLVVGARGRSSVKRVLLGSISDYVATHADCSVLVVRPSQDRNSGSELRVAIGYQDAQPAEAAVEEFSEFSWGDQTEVEVVSVSPIIDGFSRRIPATSDSPDTINSAAKHAAQRISDSAPKTKTRFIESEHVGEGIVNFLEDHRFDLVVVGETPRGMIGRLLLGSVSRFTLRHAPCSVWITRNRMTQKMHGAEKGDTSAA